MRRLRPWCDLHSRPLYRKIYVARASSVRLGPASALALVHAHRSGGWGRAGTPHLFPVVLALLHITHGMPRRRAHHVPLVQVSASNTKLSKQAGSSKRAKGDAQVHCARYPLRTQARYPLSVPARCLLVLLVALGVRPRAHHVPPVQGSASNPKSSKQAGSSKRAKAVEAKVRARYPATPLPPKPATQAR